LSFCGTLRKNLPDSLSATRSPTVGANFPAFFSGRHCAGDASPDDKIGAALAECYWPIYPDWKGSKAREIEGKGEIGE
jgi:hypothetical protein